MRVRFAPVAALILLALVSVEILQAGRATATCLAATDCTIEADESPGASPDQATLSVGACDDAAARAGLAAPLAGIRRTAATLAPLRAGSLSAPYHPPR
jgi:hypothetical protein